MSFVRVLRVLRVLRGESNLSVPREYGIQVQRVIDRVIIGQHSRLRHEEGPELPPSKRAMCSHLIIEADLHIARAVVRTEQYDVSGIGLLHEVHDGTPLDL